MTHVHVVVARNTRTVAEEEIDSFNKEYGEDENAFDRCIGLSAWDTGKGAAMVRYGGVNEEYGVKVGNVTWKMKRIKKS